MIETWRIDEDQTSSLEVHRLSNGPEYGFTLCSARLEVMTNDDDILAYKAVDKLVQEE